MNDLQIVASYSGLLTEIGVAHIVAGSLASSAWGEQRTTNDADFLVEFSAEQLLVFLERLPEGFYVDADEANATVASREAFAGFQTIYESEVFKIDNFIANDDWQKESLSRAIPLQILPGASVPFSSAEDMIIAKCRWFELGHRVSNRQWNDLIRLFEVQNGRLDNAYVVRWLRHFGLLDFWSQIQREALT